MVDQPQNKERPKARPIEPKRVIAHLEAALPEMERYDVTAGFLLRLAIHSLATKLESRQSNAA